jgi:hypothetical protein
MSYGALVKAWLWLVPAMFINGAFRELVLKRFIVPEIADAVSVAIGMALIVGITRFTLRGIAGKPTRMLVRASATLVVLTVSFEFLFGHYIAGDSWESLLDNYAIWNGRLWPLVLATIAFVPFLWGHWALSQPGARPHAGDRVASAPSHTRL